MSPRKYSSNQIGVNFSQKKIRIFHALSQHKSNQWGVVKDSFCQIPISSLIVRIYQMLRLLCDYTMVIYYILEINLTKRQIFKNGFIPFL